MRLRAAGTHIKPTEAGNGISSGEHESRTTSSLTEAGAHSNEKKQKKHSNINGNMLMLIAVWLMIVGLCLRFAHYQYSNSEQSISKPRSFNQHRSNSKEHNNKKTKEKSKSTLTQNSPIFWTVHRSAEKNTYEETYNEVYQCEPSNERVHLRKDMHEKMWFRTDIQTNLNILVMGDSVAMQIGELLQEAIGVRADQRVLLRELDEQPDHESLFWGRTSPEYGGGGAGGWRILHWWLNKNHGKPLPEETGGGWLLRDVTTLLGSIQRFDGGKRPQVDVLVFRVSQPWMPWWSMTPENMHETIKLAHDLLQVRVVVFLTTPFSNNIVDEEDIQNLIAKNAMMRKFAADYPRNEHRLDGVTVLTLDMGRLHDDVMRKNARDLGYEVAVDEALSPPDYRFTLDILKQRKQQFSRSIAHVCGEQRVPAHSTDCKYMNMITFDGQHLCMKTFGGRIFAGLACVIQCAYTHQHKYDKDGKLRRCEETCNSQYMRLNNLDPSLFVYE